jgi:hypothetical protein
LLYTDKRGIEAELMDNVESPRRIGEQVWFGIGCFHFAYQKETPYTFRREEYVADLRRALEAVPAITNVEIDAPVNELSDDDAFEMVEAPGRLEDGWTPFPFGCVLDYLQDLHSCPCSGGGC